MKLTGTVIFLKSDVNTKSEGFVPYLYVTRSEIIRIKVKGENPFENSSLAGYDGKRVEAEGEKDLNSGIFIINEIHSSAGGSNDE